MECNLKFNHYMVTYIQTANRLIKFFYLFNIVTNKKKTKRKLMVDNNEMKKNSISKLNFFLF